ncbi:hypothetical protein CCACVL1_23707 [Corchorus capsularis]|uniref:Uncharacterized protein n=1 Tax=Corchorus capsularis TaxID=210143 RepID=A0A1R3GT62_COCAP|nr:hypothetical protein CCACVL1_23707 [Corchorus capsularis]
MANMNKWSLNKMAAASFTKDK